MEEVSGKPEQRKRGLHHPQSATQGPVLPALSGCPRGRRKDLSTQNYVDGRTGRSPEDPLSPQCPGGFLTQEGGAGCVRSSLPLGTPRTGPVEEDTPVELRNHRNRYSASKRSSRSARLPCWKALSGGSLKGTHPACLVFFSSWS